MHQCRLAPSVILSLAPLLVSSTGKRLAARMDKIVRGATFAPGLDVISPRDKRHKCRDRQGGGQTASLSTHQIDGNAIDSATRQRVPAQLHHSAQSHHAAAIQPYQIHTTAIQSPVPFTCKWCLNYSPQDSRLHK